MWYAFVPGDGGLQSMFCGRTDNLVRFRTYSDMMTEFNVENIMPVTEFRTEDDCTKAMQMVLSEFPNYGDWGAAETDSIVYQSELISIENKVDQSIFVVNDMCYEFFHEVAHDTNEIKKIIADFYRLCCSYSVMVLKGYINEDADSRILWQVLDRLCEIWDEYGWVYKVHGAFGMLKTNPNSFNHDSYLWSLFDETKYLKLWVELEVRRVQSGYPRGCTYMD